MKRGLLASRGNEVKQWLNSSYREIMLAAMGLELLLLLILVVVEIALWLK